MNSLGLFLDKMSSVSSKYSPISDFLMTCFYRFDKSNNGCVSIEYFSMGIIEYLLEWSDNLEILHDFADKVLKASENVLSADRAIAVLRDKKSDSMHCMNLFAHFIVSRLDRLRRETTPMGLTDTAAQNISIESLCSIIQSAIHDACRAIRDYFHIGDLQFKGLLTSSATSNFRENAALIDEISRPCLPEGDLRTYVHILTQQAEQGINGHVVSHWAWRHKMKACQETAPMSSSSDEKNRAIKEDEEDEVSIPHFGSFVKSHSILLPLVNKSQADDTHSPTADRAVNSDATMPIARDQLLLLQTAYKSLESLAVVSSPEVRRYSFEHTPSSRKSFPSGDEEAAEWSESHLLEHLHTTQRKLSKTTTRMEVLELLLDKERGITRSRTPFRRFAAPAVDGAAAGKEDALGTELAPLHSADSSDKLFAAISEEIDALKVCLAERATKSFPLGYFLDADTQQVR